MQSKVTLTFRKVKLKNILQNDFQSKIVRHFENTGKKGGAALSAPPLNPPMSVDGKRFKNMMASS